MKKLLVICIVLLIVEVARGNSLYPFNRQVGVSINPRLEWREGEYQLYFWCLDENYTDVTKATVFEYDTEAVGWSYGRTWAQVNGLEYDTKYYWRVDIRMRRNSWDRGDIWYFTTETVPEPATLALLGLGVMMIRKKGKP